MKKCLFHFVLMLCIPIAGFSQYGLYYFEPEFPSDPYDELTFYSVGVNALTNNSYMGRVDTSAVPYLTTYAGYQLYNGLYINALASYAPLIKKGQFDVFTINAGYDRNFGKKIVAGVNFERNFFHRNSPNIRAAIEQSIDFYIFRKGHILEPQLGYRAIQGATFTDMVINFSVDHNFRFKDNAINIIPTFTLNFGSSNYLNAYYTKRLKKYDINASTAPVVLNSGNTKPLDIEFSAKTTYCKGEWLLTLVPSMFIPLSPETILRPQGKIKEATSTNFVLELDICYRHERK
jgi:hypothetical protein